MNNDKVEIHLPKSDLSEILEQSVLYMQYKHDKKKISLEEAGKFDAFCASFIPTLLNTSESTATVHLSMPTVKHLYKALRWCNVHVAKREPVDYKTMHESLVLLKAIIEQASDAEHESDNKVNTSDDGLYRSNRIPAFTSNDIQIIVKAVHSYLPVLAKKHNILHVNTEVILPRGDYKVLDADSIKLVSDALDYYAPQAVPNMSNAQKRSWSAIRHKITCCIKVIDEQVLKNLARIVRMAKHSFVREALDDLYVTEIKHNIHLHLLLVNAANSLRPNSNLVSLKTTIPGVKKIIRVGHAMNMINLKDDKGIVPYLHRLEGMKKRGYKYVTVMNDNTNNKFSLHHAKSQDVVKLVENLNNMIKKEMTD